MHILTNSISLLSQKNCKVVAVSLFRQAFDHQEMSIVSYLICRRAVVDEIVVVASVEDRTVLSSNWAPRLSKAVAILQSTVLAPFATS